MASQYEMLTRAADAVAEKLGRAPIGVVLGSGLSEALDSLERPQYLQYADIPGMPMTRTAGHPGALLFGRAGGVPVLALCGRIHIYEGRSLSDVAMPVRLLSLLGVHTLLVTSAVGSADPALKPGDIMLVEDHINFSGVNVLAGDEEPRLGPRFPDMTAAYDSEALRILEETARLAGVSCSRGVLAHFHGPSYETPAEVAMARAAGARVVSMSMVPEVLVARQRGMRVAGLANVTNMAAGLQGRPLRHEEVLRSSAANVANLQGLLAGALPRLGGGAVLGAGAHGAGVHGSVSGSNLSGAASPPLAARGKGAGAPGAPGAPGDRRT
ncbi:MAG TPA: purine-nucleoside phosphorylase [Planctomycetota bacterium]|nr:purine-nucleoside phosphorylase [Planctomycetota bacterium]